MVHISKFYSIYFMGSFHFTFKLGATHHEPRLFKTYYQLINLKLLLLTTNQSMIKIFGAKVQ